MMTSRAGAALFLVISLILFIGVLAASALSTWRLTHEEVFATQAANQSQTLRTDLEQAALYWLRSHPQPVLPPNHKPTAFLVSADHYDDGEQQISLACYLFDGHAVPTPEHARTGSALSTAVPNEMVKRIAKHAPADPFSDWLRPNLPPHIQRFPVMSTQQQQVDTVELSHDSFASWISPYSSGAININTCPVPVLEQMARVHGIKTVSDILATRTLGTHQNLPRTGGSIPWTDRSSLWYAFIHCTVATHTERWWVVIDQQRIIQRYRIE